MTQISFRETLIIILGLIALTCMGCAAVTIINDLLRPFEIRIFERIYKSEYRKYNNYIFNKEILSLSTPKHLSVLVYSDGFKNNSELRRNFMQIAYLLRRLNYISDKEVDEEVESIFAKIRQFAYSNNEPIIEAELLPEFELDDSNE